MTDRVQSLQNHLTWLTDMEQHFRNHGMILRARLYGLAAARCRMYLERAERQDAAVEVTNAHH